MSMTESGSILAVPSSTVPSSRRQRQWKKDKTMISDQEKFCAEKLAQLEESLKTKKRGDKTFSILRKTLGSFLENEGSDEEFPPDE
ncbi:hypothetical protein F2Q68_00027917 [Brassica cretica]|uniref:Uncharacterized protein n=1 Tax=Brassica cretica TaxID=69181 RepID=A0A8S9IAD4_BRACR|nr:hypothetical protein F2Q68_00027917 [Brassica cretica]